MKRQTLLTAVVALLAVACAAAAGWTAWWSLRYGLTPRPPLSALHTAVRFAVVILALILLPFRRDLMERATLVCAVIGAGASALFGLGLHSASNDVIRLLFHFLAYALGFVVSVRWLARRRRGISGGADLIQVLKEIQDLLATSSKSDWAALTPAEVMVILNREIVALETTGRVADAVELTSLFAPTAEVQEISMANGWSARYIELSSRFDAAMGST